MKDAAKSPTVFFNASVILAGLKSPQGASGELLRLAKKRKVIAVISEIIGDEVFRNTAKIDLGRQRVIQEVKLISGQILPAPSLEEVESFKTKVIDFGDCHVLASAKESKAQYLVSLDKKHLLVLQKKIKWVKILSPGQFLKKIRI